MEYLGLSGGKRGHKEVVVDVMSIDTKVSCSWGVVGRNRC